MSSLPPCSRSPRDLQAASLHGPFTGLGRLVGLVFCVPLLLASAARVTGNELVDMAGARVGSDREQEYKVKAAFLFKFLRYTTWPESAFETSESPVVVLLIGHEDMRAVVERVLIGTRVGKREVKVQSSDKLGDLDGVHALFFVGLERKERRALIRVLRGESILAIGDAENFAEEGGAANFYLKSGKVRFAVNREVVKDASLSISSELLKLAKIVKTQEQEDER